MSCVSDLLSTTSSQKKTEEREPFRIAIIGCGPKGLYALESLFNRFNTFPVEEKVEVVIYEPAEFPGAGNVYDPGQPHYLRMNFSSNYVDAWERNEEFSRFNRPTLVEWLGENQPELAETSSFVPRAIVGEYLHACFQEVLYNKPKNVRVTVHRVYVEQLVRINEKWEVTTTTNSEKYDSVLITVGHEGFRGNAPVDWERRLSQRKTPLIPSVFPVERYLGIDRVPPQSIVAIRGFGLTAIDAILALTEGRGGQFVQDETHKWSYQPSGLEPDCMLPFSRSGRPMLPKPQPDLMHLPSDLSEFWSTQRRILQEVTGEKNVSYTETICPLILTTTLDLLLKVRNHLSVSEVTATIAEVHQWWKQWHSMIADTRTVTHLLAVSYKVSSGQGPVGPAWAFGETWRQLYPVLVELISHEGLFIHEWSQFRKDAIEFERIAFGPPAENVGRILALLESGHLCFEHLTDEELPFDQSTDVVINAVLPSSSNFVPSSILSQLLEEGTIQRSPGANGILVNKSGHPLATNGETITNLAIIGRPTEGCVLGNDTLSRKMHHHPANWAASVSQQVASATSQH